MHFPPLLPYSCQFGVGRSVGKAAVPLLAGGIVLPVASLECGV